MGRYPIRAIQTLFRTVTVHCSCRFAGLSPPSQGAELCRPSRPHLLARAPERQRVGRHVPGYHAARPDVGAVANSNRRHECAIRTDERPGANLGTMLIDTVIIAENRARADIRGCADAAVAKVGQMIGLGPRVEASVF